MIISVKDRGEGEGEGEDEGEEGDPTRISFLMLQI